MTQNNQLLITKLCVNTVAVFLVVGIYSALSYWLIYKDAVAIQEPLQITKKISKHQS